MTRQNDVAHLLLHVEGELPNIKKAYDASLEKKEIDYFLRIDIKNVMENLRSALDYMAKDIAVNIQGFGKWNYFPYGYSQMNFSKSTDKTLKNLRIKRPDIYSLIEAMQPHTCGNSWLPDLCCVVSSKKHDSLVPQVRTSQKIYSIGFRDNDPIISAPAGAIDAPPGAISINKIPITFNTSTGIPQQTDELKVAVITWVSYKFQNTNIEVYPLLMIALAKIKETSKKLYCILNTP